MQAQHKVPARAAIAEELDILLDLLEQVLASVEHIVRRVADDEEEG